MRYFDLHCDTAFECYRRGLAFENAELAVSAAEGAALEEWKQVFAIWIRDDEKAPFALYRAILRDWKQKIRKKPACLTPILAVEGGAVLEDDPERVGQLKQDGVRLLTLTWNGENRIAGGAHSTKGLTDFGKEVIAGLNRAGIICDLSHLNDRSFYAVVERAEHPVATHSNCRAICDVPRNLNDDQLRLIAQKGGLIGLCFYPLFLGGEGAEALARHLYHLCELGLEKQVAVGSDFDGAVMSPELDRLSKLPACAEKLKRLGFEQGLLERFFYENAENYFKTFDKRDRFV